MITISYDIFNSNGLTPGGSSTVHIYTNGTQCSSTVHIYTQTEHRTTQLTTRFIRMHAVTFLCQLYP